ncbi:MAG TPA: class I SAM-dependent methyltransferase [Puia sp.]|nr:class I SAM-dependent methyltransferase [Puia sp.]
MENTKENKDEYKNMWDSRYKNAEYVYGTAPNDFFRERLEKMKPGVLLMPADGEGRNGVFAAQKGWEVTSLDFSIEAKTKALQLAGEKGVSIDYVVGDLEQLDFPKEAFDAIGLIYAHFSKEKKSALHRKLSNYLKPGGTVIFEAFSKKNLRQIEINPRVGGPRDIDMLFSIEEIEADFPDYEMLLLEEREVELSEGPYHAGRGSVIRFVGRKR